MTNQQNFVRFLTYQMQQQKLSLREFARRAGISASYFSHIKTGQLGIPSRNILIRIAGALNVDRDRLFVEAGIIPDDMDAETVRLIRNFIELDSRSRRIISEIVEHLWEIQTL